MPRRMLTLILIAAVSLTLACSLFSGGQPSTSPTTSPSGGPDQSAADTPVPQQDPSQAAEAFPTSAFEVPTDAPEAQPTQSRPLIDLAKSFPLAPGTSLDADSGGSEPGDTEGSFRLHSKSPVATVVKFYKSQLPQKGWAFRYSDANYQGGETQYWKKDNLYLYVNFFYDETGLAIQVQWNQVDPQAGQKLPKGLTLPDKAEIVDASNTSWQIYVPQDAGAVASDYQRELAGLGWKAGSVPGGGMEGECGDSDCSSGPSYPPGVTPLPTPTLDPRPTQTLVYTMPDGNEISLEIQPHQAATILNIQLTLKNVDSAGLPKDVPIYPGATDEIVLPGMVGFTAPADLKTVVQFYTDALTKAGWKPTTDFSLNTPDQYFQSWEKDGNSLQLQAVPASGSSTTVNIICDHCSTS